LIKSIRPERRNNPWAGIHFRSDIDTGLALGRAVAKLVIERAEKDGSQ
jgi:hypothetical protein